MDYVIILDAVIELVKSKSEAKTEFKENTLLEMILNSITYIQFMIECENKFDIEIEDDDLEMVNFRTLGDVAAYIGKRVNLNE